MWFDLLDKFFFQNISCSKKNLGRYCDKCEYVIMRSIRYSCQILMELESSEQIF